MKSGSKERIRQIALRVLSEDSYALQDNYSDESIADLVTGIVTHFNFHSTTPCIRTFEGELLIKVRNSYTGSSVSISNDEGTGVSRSLTYIISPYKEKNEDAVKEVVDMLDEAYCALYNYVV